MNFIRVPVALLLTCSMPGVAFAQVPPPPTTPAPAEPEPEPEPEVAPAPSTELTEEQKMEKAKGKYVEAEGLFNEGRYTEAVPLYEEAYYLVPGKHGFAHKVGIAAWNAGDCDKANTYLKHFLQYGDPEKHQDKMAEAKQILGEISVSGCATPTSTTTTTTTSTEAEDNENPLGESSTEKRQEANREALEHKKQEKRGLLLGGAVLTGFGVAGVGVGIAGLAIAGSAASKLGDASTNATNSGFPTGDYACRDDGEPCPYNLERNLKSGNIMGYVGLGVGGAALAGGVAMLAIYFVNKKKNAGGSMEAAPTAKKRKKSELTSVGPMLIPGGGGAAASLRF